MSDRLGDAGVPFSGAGPCNESARGSWTDGARSECSRGTAAALWCAPGCSSSTAVSQDGTSGPRGRCHLKVLDVVVSAGWGDAKKLLLV